MPRQAENTCPCSIVPAAQRPDASKRNVCNVFTLVVSVQGRSIGSKSRTPKFDSSVVNAELVAPPAKAVIA